MYSFFLAGSFQFSSCSTLPSIHFVCCLPCYPRLSIFNWVSNLIDLILKYSVCSFRYTFVSSFCAFLSFWALIMVRFLLLHKEAVFMSAHFFLIANISYRTLGLALCLVGMHSACASKWALMKFSYLSFGVGVFDNSWSASNLFLSICIYLSLISLLLSWDQS